MVGWRPGTCRHSERGSRPGDVEQPLFEPELREMNERLTNIIKLGNNFHITAFSPGLLCNILVLETGDWSMYEL